MTESNSRERSKKPERRGGRWLTIVHPLEVVVYGNLASMLLILAWQLTSR